MALKLYYTSVSSFLTSQITVYFCTRGFCYSVRLFRRFSQGNLLFRTSRLSIANIASTQKYKLSLADDTPSNNWSSIYY